MYTTKLDTLTPAEEQEWEIANEQLYGGIKTLVNISNHPSDKWSEDQKVGFEKIIDIVFPGISLQDNVEIIADDIYTKIHDGLKLMPWDAAIMVQGQHVATFAIVACLLNAGYKVLSAYTKRIVTDNPDGSKTSIFRFGGYQEYRSRNVNKDFLENFFYEVFPHKKE